MQFPYSCNLIGKSILHALDKNQRVKFSVYNIFYFLEQSRINVFIGKILLEVVYLINVINFNMYKIENNLCSRFELL